MKTLSKTSFLFILFLFSLSAAAQNPMPTSTPLETGEEEDPVKISTNLVQMDAVVTDKQGNPVTNLTAEDFELFQDGKRQTITNFSFINVETGKQKQIQTLSGKKIDKNSPLPPPVPSRSTNLGRILTFVVDDGSCDATFGGMRAAREGLEDFINKQMQPNDLVAIYKTRRGSSMLQQYTSDKSRLLQIVRKIRWYPPPPGCSSAENFQQQARNAGILSSQGLQTFENKKAADNNNRNWATVGTGGVLRYVLNGLRRIGGRKVMFVMSDGISIYNAGSAFFNSFYDLRDITELANRASVVINTIDVRGLEVPAAEASDDFGGIADDPLAADNALNMRLAAGKGLQTGLAYLAGETGGKFYKNMNYLDYPIQEALKTEAGYYLIAYQPEEETFKGKKFHKIEIKLKRPDLIVRSRSGFSGLTDKEIRPKQRTGDSELYEAIVAPLPNAGLDLRLTAFFANNPSEGNFVRALLYLDGEQISFTDDANGMKKAVFDVIAVTLNEKTEVIDEFNRTHTLRIPAANLQDIKRDGLIYSADVPVKKAGLYNFRIAVRDATSRLLGSAGQQIEVPELEKGKLFLSELILGEVTLKDGKPILPSVEKSENAFAVVPAASIPAIRRFRPGAILGYSYKIYNAGLDKTTQKPKLTVQIRLYRDGRLISDNPAQPAQLEPQSDMTRISDYGYLRLPADAAATGDYALQIIIKDLEANETASQWIDFEVTN